MNQSQMLAEKLAVKTRELHDYMGEKPSERKFSDEQIEEIRKRNQELNDIEDERLKAVELEGIEQKNRDRQTALSLPVDRVGFGASNADPRQERGHKSMGEQFVGSTDFKNAVNRRHVEIEVSQPEYKTTMTTSAGFAPFIARGPVVVPYALRRPVVADLIPQDTMNVAAVKYMEETTSTNAADQVAENSAKPESALAFTERTVNMAKVGTWIPVTEEQLKFAPQVRSVIDNRLSLFLQLKEEDKLLTGTDTSTIDGFLHKTGTQSQAKGPDPTPSAVYKAFTKIRFTGFAEPDGTVWHPNDWEPVRLLQDSTGRYIWGDPWVEGIERIWGKPVVVTPAETENTILVGDFGAYSHITRAEGITIRTTDSHSDYFIYNRLVILAEEYLTLEIYRPAAFCLVTGV